jgi:hypothetical protein
LTAQLSGMVKAGALSATANNELAGRDPARDVPKKLRVEYAIDNEPASVTVDEGRTLRIPNTTHIGTVDRVAELSGDELVAYKTGDYMYVTASGKSKTLHVPFVAKEVEVSGPWTLHFPPAWGAPDHLVLENLISWTRHLDHGVQHFSGTANYVREINIPADMIGKGKRIYLDLGEVKNLAEVKVNGKMLGTLWKPPFRIDITDVAKVGANRVTIAVTNLWPNRLIGDVGLPQAQRFTWSAFNPYKKDSPLLPSGLLGPVKLVPAAVVPLK